MSEIQTDGIIRDQNPGYGVAEPLPFINDVGKGNLPYISPTPGEIPIIAQDPIPGNFSKVLDINGGKTEIRQAECHYYYPILKRIVESAKESGFNAMICCEIFEVMDTMIDIGKELGMGTIVTTAYFYDNTDHIIKETNRYMDRANKPAAYEIMDEPKCYDWGEPFYRECGHVKQRCNSLTLGHRLMTTLDKHRLSYFNLAAPEKDENGKLPEFWIGKCGTYEKYLDVLQRLFKPGVWSYDLYPSTINANLDQISTSDPHTNAPTNTGIKYDHFYSYLSIFANHAKKTGRPFWAYSLCEGHGSVDKTDSRRFEWFKPVPTEGMLRFETFSALAFGAQGIVYWQYGKGLSSSKGGEGDLNFEKAPLSITYKDEEGEKEEIETNETKKVDGYDLKVADLNNIELHYKETDLWKAVQQVNSEIRKFSNVFLGCTFVSAGHVGKAYGDLPLITGTVAGVRVVSTGKEGVLVTRIDNNGYEYVVIVNHDPFNKQEVICILYKGREYIVSMPGQADQDCSPGNTTSFFLRRTLKEGGYLIIRTKAIS